MNVILNNFIQIKNSCYSISSSTFSQLSEEKNYGIRLDIIISVNVQIIIKIITEKFI